MIDGIRVARARLADTYKTLHGGQALLTGSLLIEIHLRRLTMYIIHRYGKIGRWLTVCFADQSSVERITSRLARTLALCNEIPYICRRALEHVYFEA